MQLGIYRHFKGNLYKVLAEVRHSETEQWLVLYHPLERPENLWVRPKTMFLGDKILNGEAVPRFVFVGND